MNQSTKQAPTALITGASRRIGAAIAKVLHHEGFRVVIHYHTSKEEAKALEHSLNQIKPDTALAIPANLIHKKEALQLIDKTLNWATNLHLLVNNASLFKPTDFNNPKELDWDEMFTANVRAPFWLSQAVYPQLTYSKGSIINITDIHAEKPIKNYAIYCQTKAALTMQTKALAREFAPDVRVNAVAPGAIAWPENENALSDPLKEKIIQATPLKQHGKPEYVAKAVLSLVSNPFITGTILNVDGGRSLV